MISSESLGVLQPAAASRRPVVLWGTGRFGETVMDRLGDTISFRAAINNLATEPSSSWRGLPVMTSTQALGGALERPFVVVATMYLDEIVPELERHGLERNVDWCLADAAVAALHTEELDGERGRWQARIGSGPVGRADLAGYTDDFWLWLNLQQPESALAGGLVAPLPSAAIQERLTGTSGAVSLTHGFNQYRLMKGMAERAGIDWSRTRRILDFGAGYARILRYFAKDAPEAVLAGVDVNSSFVEWCRAELPQHEWHLVPSLPPTAVPRESCSLVVSFSVFTHLSEASHLAWLEEIHGWLEPGGLAVLTLWTHPSKSRDYHAPHFPDYDALTGEFEAGRFCYSNLRYGAESTYGEAFAPKAFVARHWTRLFDIVEWQSAHPTSPSQTHVAIRKR